MSTFFPSLNLLLIYSPSTQAHSWKKSEVFCCQAVQFPAAQFVSKLQNVSLCWSASVCLSLISASHLSLLKFVNWTVYMIGATSQLASVTLTTVSQNKPIAVERERDDGLALRR